MRVDVINQIRASFRNLEDRIDRNSRFAESGRRSACRIDRESEIDELLRIRNDVFLVHFPDAEEDISRVRERISRGDLGLEIRHAGVKVNAHDLARGFHFRAEHHVDSGEADEREHRFLAAEMFRLDFLRIVLVFEFLSDHHERGEFCQRNADRLADERNRSRRARIDFQHIDLTLAHRKLHVHKPADIQGFRQRVSIAADFRKDFLAERNGRNHAGGVS